jgi:hypothetical protein
VSRRSSPALRANRFGTGVISLVRVSRVFRGEIRTFEVLRRAVKEYWYL